VPPDPERLPATLDEQMAALAPVIRAQAAALLTGKWAGRVSGAPAAAFRQRLDTVLKDSTGSEFLARGVNQCVIDALRPFREMVAAKELAATWPDGAALTLALAGETVGKLYDQPNIDESSVIQQPSLHMQEAEVEFTAKRHELVREATEAVLKPGPASKGIRSVRK
jgi:hypothetical protein